MEVIRFAFYASKGILGDSILTKIFGHIRYNLFILACILGVAGESLSCIYYIQEIFMIVALSKTEPWKIRISNKWNFEFDFRYILCIFYIIYLGGFFCLYLRIWSQRAKFYRAQPVN
jgi:hypothetical protein